MPDQRSLEVELRRSARLYADWSAQVKNFSHSVSVYERAVVQRRLSRLPSRVADAGTASTPGPATPPGSSPTVSCALTGRQLEIAALIADGCTNQQIAQTLCLTRGTVANHVQHILTRLALRSRTQLAVWFTNRRLSAVPLVEL